MTLASARLKASVWIPPLRGMYQRGGTCKGCDTSPLKRHIVLNGSIFHTKLASIHPFCLFLKFGQVIETTHIEIAHIEIALSATVFKLFVQNTIILMFFFILLLF